jgi:hypothetical protein
MPGFTTTKGDVVALILCPECGEQVQKSVTVCPKCSYPFCLSNSNQKTEIKKPTNTKKCQFCAMDVPKEAIICPYCRKTIGSSPAVKGCLIAVLLFFIFAIIGGITSKNKSTPDVPSEFDAFYMSQKFVNDRLKAPSTAKYPSSSDVSIKQTGNKWIVTGYVDAQNSFGAMIRQNYICEMEVSGKSWKLINVLIF